MDHPRLTDELLAWHDPASRALPWREDADAWGVLVSEVMTQQTQAERVAGRWRSFMARFPTPEHLAESSAAEVIDEWAGLGYNRRALNLHRAAGELVDRHAGRVPSDRESLLALPGVGPYTADAVRAFAHDAPVLPVDTNVARVLSRLGGAPLTRSEATTAARRWADAGRADTTAGGALAAAVMDLGATVCTARRPECDACPLQRRCAWAGGPGPDPAARSGHRPRSQGRFEGSARQARGRVVDAMRRGPVTDRVALALAGDHGPALLESLIADGLAERTSGGFALPGLSGKAQGDHDPHPGSTRP